MKYMLDTNICIYIIREKPEEVLRRFKNIEIGDVCISSVTLSELTYGVQESQHKHKNSNALHEFILPLEIVSFNEKAAFYYGILRAEIERKGTPIGPMDLMIAAHAQSLGSILVTNNEKEFSRAPELIVENWVSI